MLCLIIFKKTDLSKLNVHFCCVSGQGEPWESCFVLTINDNTIKVVFDLSFTTTSIVSGCLIVLSGLVSPSKH